MSGSNLKLFWADDFTMYNVIYGLFYSIYDNLFFSEPFLFSISLLFIHLFSCLYVVNLHLDSWCRLVFYLNLRLTSRILSPLHFIFLLMNHFEFLCLISRAHICFFWSSYSFQFNYGSYVSRSEPEASADVHAVQSPFHTHIRVKQRCVCFDSVFDNCYGTPVWKTSSKCWSIKNRLLWCWFWTTYFNIKKQNKLLLDAQEGKIRVSFNPNPRKSMMRVGMNQQNTENDWALCVATTDHAGVSVLMFGFRIVIQVYAPYNCATTSQVCHWCFHRTCLLCVRWEWACLGFLPP